MPAKRGPDGELENVQPIKPRPKKQAGPFQRPYQAPGLSPDERLIAVGDDVAELGISIEGLNEDLIKSVDSLRQALSILQSRGGKEGGEPLKMVLLEVRTMTERVDFMLQAFSTFSTILASQDAVSRKRARAMLSGMEAVAAKVLAAEKTEAKPAPPPAPTWLTWTRWGGIGLVSLLAVFGLMSLLGLGF